jgi:REP-associated tyrosine transposase
MNLYHVSVETPKATLLQALRQLNGVMPKRSTGGMGKSGTCCTADTKSILVDKDSSLLELARYVVPNPLRPRAVNKPEPHRWASLVQRWGLILKS